nr:PadR family transcriptional regulator [Cellulosimicrobium sp. MM]
MPRRATGPRAARWTADGHRLRPRPAPALPAALLASGPKQGTSSSPSSPSGSGALPPERRDDLPAPRALEDEGLVHRSADGRKTTYELTPAGRAEIEARRADVAALEHGIAETVRQRAEALRADVQGSLRGCAPSSPPPPRRRAPARATASRHPPSRVDRAPAEAEAVLQRFRDELRADLRRADATGGCPS